MVLKGLCSICGRPGIMHSCNLCGQLVCSKCFDNAHGVCVNCKKVRK